MARSCEVAPHETTRAYDDRALAQQAAAVTGDLQQLLDYLTTGLVNYRHEVDRLLGGAPIRTPLGAQDSAAHDIQSAIPTLAVARMWSRGRTVYAMHPQMVAELTDCGDSKLPSSVFDHLPHINPFVAFPEPVQTVTSEGEDSTVLGFVVYGRPRGSYGLCDSNDANRGDIGLMFLVSVPTAHQGKSVVDTDVIRVTLPLEAGTFSVDDAAAAVMRTFTITSREPSTRERVHEWITELIRLAVNTLLYVCTDDPDMHRVVVPPTKRAGKKNRGKPKPVTRSQMVKVGWRLGPILHQARRAATANPSFTAGGRRRPRTHQRCAHYQLYRVGKGRRDSVLKFIKPVWVNLALADAEDTQLTVMPVHPTGTGS
jgi:hypothetical protein